MYEEVVEEGRGQKIESPRVQRSKGLKVAGSHGPKDQDISKSLSNTSFTLKKVHLVLHLEISDVLRQLASMICWS